jgi:hypothetical protein
MGSRLSRRSKGARQGVSATPLLLAACAVAAVSIAAQPIAVRAAAAPAESARQEASSTLGISGVWWTKTYSPKLEPLDGPLPLTPAGKRAYDKNIAALKDGSLKDEARTICLAGGMPRVMAAPYPFQIIQTPDGITFAHEVNHSWRFARLGGMHPAPDDAIPYYNGDEIAKWEGDTLVVDTVNLNERTFLDATGLPHGPNLHVTERLRLLDGGKSLEDVITVQDPMMFTKPWRTRLVFDKRPDIHIDEFVCAERHRSLSGVKGAPVERATLAP